tara:strand:+ start:2320 stop:2706 length:387 start_codon:yes stop_codon:yes gene_type:complete
MPRKKKQHVKINNTTSLEGVLQEVYNEACVNIKDAQSTINELSTSAEPVDVDDFTKISKAKTDAIREKTANIKVKLEIAKLQNDSIKHAGDIAATLSNTSGGEVNLDDFSMVRKMIAEKSKSKPQDEE